MEVIQQAETVDEDERRVLLYLLSDTRVRVECRLKTNMAGEYFATTTRVPQGDALSPVLLVVYL